VRRLRPKEITVAVLSSGDFELSSPTEMLANTALKAGEGLNSTARLDRLQRVGKPQTAALGGKAGAAANLNLALAPDDERACPVGCLRRPLRTTTERADWLPDRFRIALTERASARTSRVRSLLVPSGQVIGCEAGYRSAR
jgi:hypothetical protein